MYIHADNLASNFTSLVEGYAAYFSIPYFGSDLEAAKKYKRYELDCIRNSPACATSAKRLLAIRQLVALLSKNPSISGATPEVRQQTALASFLKSEQKCRITSRRLSHYTVHTNRAPRVMASLMRSMQLDIFKLLGPVITGDDYNRFIEGCTFGPGTVGGLTKPGRGKSDPTPFGKLDCRNTIQVTFDALALARPFLIGNGPLHDYLRKTAGEIVEHNRVTFVRKDAGTDRTIAVEPYFNSFLQMGQMSLLADKLRQWGVDTRDQTKNQHLARKGSMDGSLVTVDLSAASDSVTTVLVNYLLPKEWSCFLGKSRCKYSLLPDGSRIQLSKFSSMGNGVTFPLECLIFAAAVRACRQYVNCKEEWAVFGDDIICSQRCSLLLTELLKFLGFSVNTDKSFYFGSFRESCGKDYLGGHPVRPYYLKSALDDFSIHRLVNQLSLDDTQSPYLWHALMDKVNNPIFGPRANNVPITHFIAPIVTLRRLGLLKWNRTLQSYQCVQQTLTTVYPCISRGTKAKPWNASQALSAFLAKSMSSDTHLIRGPVFIETQVNLVPVLGAQVEYDGKWYSLERKLMSITST